MTNWFKKNKNHACPEVYGCDDCKKNVACAFFPSPFDEDDVDMLLCEECYNRAVEISRQRVEARLAEVPELRKWLKEHEEEKE